MLLAFDVRFIFFHVDDDRIELGDFILAAELDDAAKLITDLFEFAHGDLIPELIALDAFNDRLHGLTAMDNL